MGISTRLTSSACLNQVSENIYASFFPPLLSSLLNPGAVGTATCDKSTSNMVQGKYLYSTQIQRSLGLGKGSWNRHLPSHCPVSAFPCLWQKFSGSRQGNTWLSLVPLQLGLFGLCIATHPTVKAVWVTANCRILYAMLSLKFRVFPPLYQEQVPKGRGWSWLLIQEPNSAPKVTDEPQRLKYKHLVCRYVESLWYISYLTDGKPANISKSLMP